eukprot:Ihof_evm4s199 gene=Ihof_evmTU4s199
MEYEDDIEPFREVSRCRKNRAKATQYSNSTSASSEKQTIEPSYNHSSKEVESSQGSCRTPHGFREGRGSQGHTDIPGQPLQRPALSLAIFMNISGPKAFSNQHQIRRFVMSCICEADIDMSLLIFNLSSPAGIEWLHSFVEWAPKFSSTAGEKSDYVSFQRVVVPFFSLLSNLIKGSVLFAELNTIITTLNRSVMLSNIARCLPFPPGPVPETAKTKSDTILEAKTWHDIWCPLIDFIRQLMAKFPTVVYEESTRELSGLLIKGAKDWMEYEKVGISRSLRENLNAIKTLIEKGKQDEEHTKAVEEKEKKMEQFKKLFGIGVSDSKKKMKECQDLDGPGELSIRDEKRHDNDFINYTEIQLVPTQEEAFCPLAPYLPRPGSSDILGMLGLSCIHRHLGQQFRLLRHDMLSAFLANAPKTRPVPVKGLTDEPSTIEEDIRKEFNTKDLFICSNVKVLCFRKKEKGDYFYEIEFNQQSIWKEKKKPVPKLMRDRREELERYWENTQHLRHGSLICLWFNGSNIDESKAIDSVPHMIFATVVERNVKTKPNLLYDEERARIGVLPCDQLGHEALFRVMFYHSRDTEQMTLVEVCQSYFSYKPVLQALKRLGKSTVPFTTYLVTDKPMPITFPEYINPESTMYDLSFLAKPDADTALVKQLKKVAVGQPGMFPLATLMEASTLDEGQAIAMMMALTNQFALIQGPPGTGKTYVSVKIVQALLQNTITQRLGFLASRQEPQDSEDDSDNVECEKSKLRRKINIGPIVCVCLTNHALDQFLCELIDNGVRSVVRIGKNSKDPRLDQYNLDVLAREFHLCTWHQKRVQGVFHALGDMESLLEESQSYLSFLLASEDECVDWEDVEELVRNSDPYIYEYITLLEQNETEVDEFGLIISKGDPLTIWLQEGSNSQSLKSKELANNFKDPDDNEDNLSQEFSTSPSPSFSRLRTPTGRGFIPYDERPGRLDSCYDDVKMNILKKANVIGLTTNGLARHKDIIAALEAKVLVVEEAAEVLEAQTLASLTYCTQHIILIGDHLQLRPKCEDYTLSIESKCGYNLDVSLFERIALSHSNDVVTLTTQRRMHPSISELIRVPIYHSLQDSASVHGYPEVRGMERRLFFLDHDGKEHEEEVDSDNTSKRNQSEVEWVVGLTKYLLQQGYEPGDIAVLTPYTGQLRELKVALEKVTLVFVDGADAEALALDCVEEEGKEETREDEAKRREDRREKLDSVMSNAAPLHTLVRMATIDNFQGEQAKVIIISLVRNNPHGMIGFLRTPNRTNVLLSRAKHGMYIFGNTSTLQAKAHGNMWGQVLTILEKEGNLGKALTLRCPNHPNRLTVITQPKHFATLAGEGGCSLQCDYRLPCGHSCKRACHTLDRDHVTYTCASPCNRPQPCGHPCEAECGAQCPLCTVEVEVPLPCNHYIELPCQQVADIANIKCQKIIRVEMKGCGHQVRVKCSEQESVSQNPTDCPALCSTPLPCGHICWSTCGSCLALSRRVSGNVHLNKRTSHQICHAMCGRQQDCIHCCTAKCHSGEPCVPCTRKCPLSCVHAKCAKLCVESCSPCPEPCVWQCVHQEVCPLPCGAPCSRLPCDERCNKILPCGHLCPSLCGEPCPDSSLVCPPCVRAQEGRTGCHWIDFTMTISLAEHNPDNSPLVQLPCGHCYTMDCLDEYLGIDGAYIRNADGTAWVDIVPLPSMHTTPKLCPRCCSPIWGIHRYNRIINQGLQNLCDRKFWFQVRDMMEKAETVLAAALRETETEETGARLPSRERPGPCSLVTAADNAMTAVRTYITVVNMSRQPPNYKLHKAITAVLQRSQSYLRLLPPEPNYLPVCKAMLGLGLAHIQAMYISARTMDRLYRLGLLHREQSQQPIPQGQLRRKGREKPSESVMAERTVHEEYLRGKKVFEDVLMMTDGHKCLVTKVKVLLAMTILCWQRAYALGFCLSVKNKLPTTTRNPRMAINNSGNQEEGVDMKSARLGLLQEAQDNLKTANDIIGRILANQESYEVEEQLKAANTMRDIVI